MRLRKYCPPSRLGGRPAVLGFYATVLRSRPLWFRGRQTDRFIESRPAKTRCPDHGGDTDRRPQEKAEAVRHKELTNDVRIDRNEIEIIDLD